MDKPISDYYTNRGYLMPKCKFCVLQRSKVYYKLNRIKILKKIAHPRKLKTPEELKATQKIRKKIYYKKNKEKISNYHKEYRKIRWNNDPFYIFKKKTRGLLSGRRVNKMGKKTNEILGCSYEFFYKYIESQFDNNMTWENRGEYWVIDHYIPLASANSDEEVLKLFHYSNLRPLEFQKNKMKLDKFEVVTSEGIFYV